MNEKYPLALPEGTVLAGQYIIEKVLGQGGFGITYEAKDHKTGQKVAVKEFFPDAMATRTNQTTVQPFSGERGDSYAYGKSCFLQEAETLAEFIGNENIVRIHSYFEENETAYFVMDFIEGTSFDEYLKQRGGKISFEEAAGILIPVMDALNIVHARGIVHRDVTPDNIYITKEGVVKLLDFGAARYSLGDKSRSLDVVLKHGFAPKEQYARRGKQGPFTDVYALGATFYFALTGRRPPDSIERMDEDDLIPPSTLGVQISKAAEEAILQALRVQPGDRFQSMAAFKNAMAYSVGGGNQQVSGNGPAAPQQRFFTAPAQDAPAVSNPVTPGSMPVGNSPVGQSADGQNAASPQGKKKSRKKMLFLAAAVPVAAALIFMMVLIVRKGGLIEKSYIPAMAQGQDAASERYAILGNSAGNLMNFGYCATWEGIDYYITDDGGTLYAAYEGGGEEIFSREANSFYQLSAVDGKLYYMYQNHAYTYDLENETEKEIPVLQQFGGNINRLYIMNDYFFIWCRDGGIYRVSKTGGESTKCCTITYGNEFTFSDDGWLYYITKTQEEQYPIIKRMKLDTLEEDYNAINFTSANYAFANPLVIDGSLYLYCFDLTGSGDMSIYRFNKNLDINAGYVSWKIDWSKLRQMNVKSYTYEFNVNRVNNDIYFCQTGLVDGVAQDAYLYKIKPNENGTMDEFTLVAEGASKPHILYYKDNSIDLLYQQRTTYRGDMKLQVQRFDAEGNKIND